MDILLLSNAERPSFRDTAAAFHKHRATRRIPSVSVYCIWDDATAPAAAVHLAQRGLLFMLKESFPCNLFRMDLRELMAPSPNASLHQHWQYRSLQYLFHEHDDGLLLLVDAAARCTTVSLLSASQHGARTVVRRAQSPSLARTAQVLHMHTGLLPNVELYDDAEDHTPDETRDGGAGLPSVWANDTVDAMRGAVRRGHVLWLRQALVTAVADRIHDNHTMVVCGVTGGECDGLLHDLAALCGEDDRGPLRVVPAADLPQFAHCCEEAALWLQVVVQPPGDSSNEKGGIRIAVYRQRHLLFHGLRELWVDGMNARRRAASAVEVWRQDVLGCRIAKSFGAKRFVGVVTFVDRDPQFPQSMDHDLLTIRYEDGDVEDFNISEFYEHLELFIHTSRDNSDETVQEHRAAALNIYERVPTLAKTVESRNHAPCEGPEDADVALVVQTAMQEASSFSKKGDGY